MRVVCRTTGFRREPWPGVVEVVLTDALGRVWELREKSMMFNEWMRIGVASGEGLAWVSLPCDAVRRDGGGIVVTFPDLVSAESSYVLKPDQVIPDTDPDEAVAFAIAHARRELEAGAPTEEILSLLRAAGLTWLHSIEAIAELLDVSIATGKGIVGESATWRDFGERRHELEAQLMDRGGR